MITALGCDRECYESSHLAAQRHLENVSIRSSTEQEVLAGVKGHRHDLHIKQNGQEQLTGGQLPHLHKQKNTCKQLSDHQVVSFNMAATEQKQINHR